tara:strand:- start:7485 stop:7757 length:273 start_codon:yes stop_codon:yes gene_type:complete
VSSEQIVFLGHRSIEGGTWEHDDKSLYTGMISGPSEMDKVIGMEYIPVFVPRHANWISMEPWTGKVPITNVLEYDKEVLREFNAQKDDAS